MIRQKRINLYRVLITLSIFSFLGMLIFNTAFLHVHVTIDGKVVVHSHFNNDAKTKKESKPLPAGHSHSKCEYYFYNTLNNYDKFILTPINLAPYYYESRIIAYVANDNLNSFIFYASLYLRAPPTC